MNLDPQKLEAFMNRAVGEIGAAASAVMALIGDRLGLYKALAEGPATPGELAQRTGTAERYVREWLSNQAAGGFVAYDAASGKFSLEPEQVATLAQEDSPFFLPGAFQTIASMFLDHEKIVERFKSGEGLDWGGHHHLLFTGTERFFRPNYIGNLIQSWIPALDGVEAKLKSGAIVADVGCGLGASTILMAQAYPKSKFLGFDFHAASIEEARHRAKQAGVAERVDFEVAESTNYPGNDYDLVAHFDCLHDMGDPVAVARHVKQSLKPDGTWMIVEPRAGDKLEDNLNPVGRVFYAASTCVCVPASLAQDGPALGAQAGEKRLRGILEKGGFAKIRRAAETPFNMVLEAR